MKNNRVVLFVLSIGLIVFGMVLAISERSDGIYFAGPTFYQIYLFAIWIPILLSIISIALLIKDIYVTSNNNIDKVYTRLWFPTTFTVYTLSIMYVYITLKSFSIIAIAIYIILVIVLFVVGRVLIKSEKISNIGKIGVIKYHGLSYCLAIVMYLAMRLVLMLVVLSGGTPF